MTFSSPLHEDCVKPGFLKLTLLESPITEDGYPHEITFMQFTLQDNRIIFKNSRGNLKDNTRYVITFSSKRPLRSVKGFRLIAEDNYMPLECRIYEPQDGTPLITWHVQTTERKKIEEVDWFSAVGLK
jgi:hypothetical protein